MAPKEWEKKSTVNGRCDRYLNFTISSMAGEVNCTSNKNNFDKLGNPHFSLAFRGNFEEIRSRAERKWPNSKAKALLKC